MKTIIILLGLVLTVNISAQNNELKTVKSVDLKKYVGTWYEISKIPNKFQKQCVKGTTAQYKLNEDGEIEVINSCIDIDGEKDVANGLARIVDKNTNSKLEVSFVSIFGWHLFWGDYWVIGLGENYEYAVVGTPSRKYGWILSRTPQLDKEKLDEAYKVLEDSGYKIKDFELSKQ